MTPTPPSIPAPGCGKTLFEGKKTITSQRWKEGRLVWIDGIVPFTRGEDEIHRTLGKIEESGTRPKDPLPAQREAALRVLKAYRYLAGEPWQQLSLSDDLNARAQAGAELCRRIGRIEHNPENPGLPPSEYEFALSGTSSSNVHMGVGDLPEAVMGFMDDSDPKNIARVGHRAWCINPTMGKTGFGLAGGSYAAMWANDVSGRPDCEYDLLTYPPRGQVPCQYFGARHAWSIWPTTYAAAAKPGRIRVAINQLDEHYRRAKAPLALDFDRTTLSDLGPGPVVVFRPQRLVVAPGMAYAVVVEGLPVKPNAAPYWYLVRFVE